MAGSKITVSSLTATGGPGNVALTWVTVGGGAGCLNYLALKAVEVWSATTNNRAHASFAKLGEGVSIFAHAGLTGTTPRYYWVRAVDASNNLGAYFPTSATGGIAGTPTRGLGPGQVTNDDLAGAIDGLTKILNASIGNAQILSLSASKLTAGDITATISITAPNINGGVINGALLTGGRLTVSGAAAFPIINLQPIAAAGVSGVMVYQSGLNGEAALYSVNAGGGPTAHGLRAANRGPTFGGSGLVGVPSVGGGWAFYAEAGAYGPFTGSHDAFLRRDVEVAIGDIVADLRVIMRKGINDTVTEVGVCDQVAMNNAVGVVAGRVAFDPNSVLATFIETANTACNFLRRYCNTHFDRLVINAVGEGQVNVCGRGGNLAPGDLICTSDLRGKGQRQADDLVRASSVAKVREAVTFSHPDEVKLVACIYLCG